MQLSKETSLFKKESIENDINYAKEHADNYITQITNDGIFVHQTDSGKDGTTPTASTAYGVHISDDVEIIKGGVSVAEYGTTARVGVDRSSRFLMNSGSLQAYDGSNNKYFEVSASGMSFGSNTVATTAYADQAEADAVSAAAADATSKANNAISTAAADATSKANNAAKTATNYITKVTDNGITVHPSSGDSNRVAIDGNGMSVYKGGNLKATYGDSVNIYGGNSSNGSNPKVYIGSINVQMVNDANNYANVNSSGLQVHQGGAEVASFGSNVRIGKPTSSNEGNVFIDSDSVDIRKGSTVLSTFTANGAELGRNSNTAIIDLCAGAGRIRGSITDTISANDTYQLEILNKDTSKNCHTIFMESGETRLWLDDYGGHESAFHTISGAGTPSSSNKGTCSILAESASSTFSHIELAAGGAWVDVRSGSSGDDGDITVPHVDVNGRLLVNDYTIWSQYTYDHRGSSTNANLYIGEQGRIWRTGSGSSKRYKHAIKDIENVELDPHNLYDVEVKQFIFNDDFLTDENDCRYHKELAGFIAEQVYEHYPTAVDINEKGECENWNAQYIIPPMLALIQEQHKHIEELTKRVEALERIIK